MENLILLSKLVKLLESHEREYVKFSSGYIEKFIVLEQIKEIAFYQEQPFVIPYELDGTQRTYYPDVFFVIEDGRGVVVEVKPRYQMALHENLTKWSALQKYCCFSQIFGQTVPFSSPASLE